MLWFTFITELLGLFGMLWMSAAQKEHLESIAASVWRSDDVAAISSAQTHLTVFTAISSILSVIMIGVSLAGFAARHRMPASTYAMKELTTSRSGLACDVRDLAAAIVPHIRLHVFLDYRSASVVPSIDHVGTDTYQLYLPQGFALFWSRERGPARALLAHELGHVYLRDFDLWKSSRRIAPYVHWIVGANLVLSIGGLVVDALLGSWSWPLAVVKLTRISIITHLGCSARGKLEIHVDDTEKKCDQVAAAYVHAASMATALTFLCVSGPSTGARKSGDASLSDRVGLMYGLAQRWSSPTAQPSVSSPGRDWPGSAAAGELGRRAQGWPFD